MKTSEPIEPTELIACLCEGGAEKAIVNRLLDADKLIFVRENLLEHKPIRCRDAKEFQERYLKKEFPAPIRVYRILDSRKEAFKLGKAYRSKVHLIDVITAPEIEILIIHAEGKFAAYKKSKKKPSAFCKQELKMSRVKSEDFVAKYFSDIDKLLGALQCYRKKSKLPTGEKSLIDLVKQN